jgi:hypothetical protein
MVLPRGRPAPSGPIDPVLHLVGLQHGSGGRDCTNSLSNAGSSRDEENTRAMLALIDEFVGECGGSLVVGRNAVRLLDVREEVTLRWTTSRGTVLVCSSDGLQQQAA